MQWHPLGRCTCSDSAPALQNWKRTWLLCSVGRTQGDISGQYCPWWILFLLTLGLLQIAYLFDLQLGKLQTGNLETLFFIYVKFFSLSLFNYCYFNIISLVLSLLSVFSLRNVCLLQNCGCSSHFLLEVIYLYLLCLCFWCISK